MSITINDDQKYEILKTVRAQRIEEARFWRNRSWNVTTWLIGLSMTISGAAIFAEGNHRIAAIPLISLAIVTSFYLQKNYRNYRENLQCLSLIDDQLGLFTKDIFVKDKVVYPSRWKNPDVTFWGGTGIFLIAIWVMSISCSVAIILK